MGSGNSAESEEETAKASSTTEKTETANALRTTDKTVKFNSEVDAAEEAIPVKSKDPSNLSTKSVESMTRSNLCVSGKGKIYGDDAPLGDIDVPRRSARRKSELELTKSLADGAITAEEKAKEQQFRIGYRQWRMGKGHGNHSLELEPSMEGIRRSSRRNLTRTADALVDNIQHPSSPLKPEAPRGRLSVLLTSGLRISGECLEALDQSEMDLITACQDVLNKNWIGNSTKPAPALYPHQWSWDSAFIAMGLAHFNQGRAQLEMRTLFQSQWANGMVPHTVFNPDPVCLAQYFPGPDFWNITTSANAPTHGLTTGICQPPVHSTACWHIYQHAKDKASAKRFLKHMFPKLVAWHQYLYRDRDPNTEGLVYVRHMWESGMDNTPMWDAALDSMELTPEMIPPYTRKDTLHVDPRERPTKFFYDRVVYLIKLFIDNAYNEEAIGKCCPFLMQDVLFNSLLARGNQDLALIAEELGEDPVQYMKWAAWTNAAINAKLWNGSFYCDYNLVSQSLSPHRTSVGFTPLWSEGVPPERLRILLDLLEGDEFGTTMPVASTSLLDAQFDPNKYWRGPSWFNLNYLITEGLARCNSEDAQSAAQKLRETSIDKVRHGGAFEYWNPVDGTPCGTAQFSWTAALSIVLLCTTCGEDDGFRRLKSSPEFNEQALPSKDLKSSYF